ncbi:MAG: fimbrial protein [Scandinavium sp.]|uniref:fimbrial protein n=1 Tax=Scandinavium sp. TaxID=2830653 RepID=UPI003F37B41E
MKLNKLAVVMGLVLASGSVMAAPADMGHGTVTFSGSIIEAPCSITPESVDQTVDLGQVSSTALANGGKSAPKAFQIELKNCDLGTLTKVKTLFTGATSAGNPDLLGISGSASGASIAITDGSGQVIDLGTASAPQTLQNGNNTLSFSAYLQGDGASATVVPGDFTSVANFSIAYE